MFIDDFGDDGEAESGAARFGGEERIEDGFDAIGRDAGAMIDDAHLGFDVLGAGWIGDKGGFDAHGGGRWRGLNGVQEQVDKDALEQFGIEGEADGIGGGLKVDGDLAGLGVALCGADSGGDHGEEIGWGAPQFERAREIKEARDQGVCAIDFA